MGKLSIVDFFKDRKRIIYDRGGDIPYLVRYYVFLKDRQNFPFNVTLHKVLESDEPQLHDHPWDWGAMIVKGGYWEHTPEGKFWRRPGHIRFRKAEDLHYLELAKDKDGNEFSMENNRVGIIGQGGPGESVLRGVSGKYANLMGTCKYVPTYMMNDGVFVSVSFDCDMKH